MIKPIFDILKCTKRTLFLTLLLVGASINSAHSEQNNSITWATEAFTPFYISQGSNNGNGTVDKLLDMLEEEMGGFEHHRRLIPILRIIEELKAQSQIACASFLYDLSTDGFAQYSIPLFAVPPQELVVKRSAWEKVGSPKSISLKEALSSGKLSMGLVKGRNYGTKLNGIIDIYKQDSSKIYYRVGDHFNGLADMIVHNRIDATIAYSGEVNFFLSESKLSEPLVHVPIEENDKALLVYIVMPKSKWGDAFLKQVNEAIYHIRLRPDYIATIEPLFEHSEALDFALENLIEHSKMHFKIENN